MGIRVGMRTFGLPLALVVSVLALYWPVREHGFVSYDDEVYLTQNPHVVKGLDWGEIRWVFTHEHAANYHPLTWVSHMLDVELFGLEPGPHHLVNVALHALNAVLVFFLCRSLLGSDWGALLAAAFFALHPLRVESVAWASERKDLLCAAFFLAAALLYLRYGRAPSVGRYLLVVLAATLALLAKPMAVTLPCVCLLLDVWPLRRLRVGDAGSHPGESARAPAGGARYGLFLEKLPLFALAALGALSTWSAQEVGGAVSRGQAVPFDLRSLNALATYGTYLRESFWPARLAVFHPLAAVVEDHPRAALLLPALASALVLALVGLLAWRWRGRHAWLLIGWAWLLGTLVPVIGLKQVGAQAHADRYTYLPLVGVAWIVAGIALELGRRRRFLVLPLGVLASGAVLALALAARAQLRTWRDTHTLFERALQVTEKNYVAHASLGSYLLDQGERTAAEEHLRAALDIYALDTTALTNLGRLYLDAGDLARAEQHLERAKEIVATKQVRYHLGRLRMRQGDPRRAAREFTAALELDPSLFDAHYRLGQVLLELGDKDGARAGFERTLALEPRHPGAWNGLGLLALDAGDALEAERCLLRAVDLDPAYADAVNNLGVALERQGRLAEARERYAEAQRLYTIQRGGS